MHKERGSVGDVRRGVLKVWGSNLCPTALNMPLAISPGS